jgi:hypothetical protein
MDRSRLGALRTVSSHPRGVMATVGEQTQLQPNSPAESAEIAAPPRIGIGLPMSNIFATYAFTITCQAATDLCFVQLLWGIAGIGFVRRLGCVNCDSDVTNLC